MCGAPTGIPVTNDGALSARGAGSDVLGVPSSTNDLVVLPGLVGTASDQSLNKAGPSHQDSSSSSGGSPARLKAPIGGGLAARRNFKGSIQVAAKKGADKSPFKRITWCTKLSENYELGGEVMPSCHSGMQVLFGKQRATGLDVVVKVRHKKNSFKDNEEQEWRISTEYMMNLPCASGKIARIFEVLEDAMAYYVVMEKCNGQDLFESIHNESKLTPDETKEVLFQILTALCDMHAEGLVHKDLKLENVMIERTPSTSTSAKQIWRDEQPQASSPLQVKLVDFDTVEEHTPKTPKRAKDVLGTDQYIAQEAYAGMYSPASDIFAVGVIGYRLLVGRFPFDARMFNDKPGENWVGSPKMKEIREKLCKYQVNYEHRVFQRDPTALDLIRSMLAVKESDRPSAKEALQHRFFTKSSSPRTSRHSQGATGSQSMIPRISGGSAGSPKSATAL